MDIKWKKFFGDPSQWLDCRHMKLSPKFPDFKHKETQDSLWIDGWYNPSWVREELRRRGLFQTSRLEHEAQHFLVHGKLVKADVDPSHALVASLKNCANNKDLYEGSKLHDQIRSSGLLAKNDYLGSTLISMYVKCGALPKAKEAFHELPIRVVSTWNALLSGYIQQGMSKDALDCFCHMRSEGLSPDAFTYTCTLKACGMAKDIHFGEQIHYEIVCQELLPNAVLGNALVDMYAKCGVPSKAQEMLDELPVRDVVSWTSLIAGYTQTGESEKAIICYDQMRREGFSPDAKMYACILKAYGAAKELKKGKQIHEELSCSGLLQKDIVLGTALVEMYTSCGELTKAQQVLDKLPCRDTVSWSALIDGYTQQGQWRKAIECYDRMQREGLSPNAITYICVLKACGIAKEIDRGARIHQEIASQGLLEKDIVLGNALVDMYAKCGVVTKARKVVDELHVRDIISWSALMAGYAQEGQGEEAKDCVERMQSEGLVPNIVSWNTLIGGYAQGDRSEKALGFFWQMQREGISPDATTLVCVLNACSHSGLVDEGQMLFENMEEEFGIKPNIEHHACMVDLFGRNGQFEKAMAVIEKLQPFNYLAVWSALMGACQKWGNFKLGRLAFDSIVQINEHDVGAYICMESIYAAAGMQQEAEEIESTRVKCRLEAEG